MIGFNLGKNFSGAGQWRVGGDKEQKKQRLANNPVTYLSSNAQCQGGNRVTEAPNVAHKWHRCGIRLVGEAENLDGNDDWETS